MVAGPRDTLSGAAINADAPAARGCDVHGRGRRAVSHSQPGGCRHNGRMQGDSIPRLKVCGVTRAADLELLASAGVDSVGINLVSASPRSVDVARAQQLCARAAELQLCRVVVVMNPTAAELDALLDQLDMDFVQLHGGETPALLDATRHFAAGSGPGIIKAVSWSGRDEEAALVDAWLRTLDAGPQRPRLAAFLVDAYAPQVGGGSGRTARWDLLTPRPPALTRVPLLLAGGLTAENVGQAIAQVAPDGVDTASGVEVSPGVKDPHKVRRFASTAEAAWRHAE